MARGSPREVKGRGKEEGGVGACGKPRFTYPEREVGCSGRKGRAGGSLLSVTWAPRLGVGESLGWGCPLECPDSGVAFPNPRSILRTFAPVPQEDGREKALGGLGQWLHMRLACRQARTGEKGEGKTYPWTASVKAKAGL